MRTIGIVGAGLMGSHHLWALQELERAGLVDATVTHVHDLDPARAAALGLPVCETLEGLVDAVDVVWVTTWTAGHLAPCAAAVRAGKAVFVEKPLAPTWAECQALADVLRPARHQVGLILRHAPAYRFLVELVASGVHGRPMGALFRDDQRFPLDGPYGSTWRADVEKAGGGTLIEHSIHDVDVLAWLLGTPTSVSAQTHGFSGRTGIEDTATLRLAFPGGHSASLLSVWHRVEGRTTARRIEVFCEDAVIWMDGEVGPVHVQTSAGTVVHDIPLPVMLAPLGLAEVDPTWRDAAAGLALQAKAFLDALDRDEPGWPTVDDALVAHRVVEAAYRSAAADGVLEPCS